MIPILILIHRETHKKLIIIKIIIPLKKMLNLLKKLSNLKTEDKALILKIKYIKMFKNY